MRTRTALIIGILAAAALPAPAAAKQIHVHPGDSIQAAINKAKSGDRVLVAPGTYKDNAKDCAACALSITKDGIKLSGAGKKPGDVVIQAKKGQETGINVSKANPDGCLKKDGRRVKGSEISNLKVTGFKENGIVLFCVDDWRITHARAVKNDEYGFFPLFSGKGRLDHSFASGANDTGFYVGQSHDVRMDHNTAVNNVSGFELENTVRSLADFNVGHDNTAGLLSFALPNLKVKINRNNQIRNNFFHHNNRDNTCEDEHDVVCNVPPGAGIILVATDKNQVFSNRVKFNRTGGIALVSYCIIADSPCEPDIDPNPDNNKIVSNTVTGNGKNPAHPYEGVAADLIWDTTGKGNCWGDNTFATTYPPDGLPSCP